MDVSTVKGITELGSFGVLVALLIGIVWVVRAAVPKLIARLDAHLEKMEELQASLSATLASMQADNRTHYERDSAEQRDIDKRLTQILVVVESEHVKTRDAILEAMKNG